jgi:magnesium transporter
MPSEDSDRTEIEELISQKSWTRLREKVQAIHPYDLSLILRKLGPEERKEVMGVLPRSVLMELIPELQEEEQLEMVEVLPPQFMAELLSRIPPDEMADVLKDLPVESRRKIIQHFSHEKTSEARELLQYPPDTAGGLMTLEVVALPLETTVQEAIEHIRRKARKYEAIPYVYVVTPENELVGVVSLRQLVLASPRDRLEEVMNPEVIKVPVGMDQEEVAKTFSIYDLLAVPVVDDRNRLLGMVTVDDILDVIEEEAMEDISHLAGTGREIDKLINAPALAVVKARLPWLLFALVGDGLIASWLIRSFETTLASTVALALFIPVVMTMGGSVGVQSSTIFVRGLATGEIHDPLGYFFREIQIGFLMGTLVALGIGLFSHLLVGLPVLGFIVGGAMFATMTLASATGILYPMLFQKLGIDPAFSSNPFITTTQDITGLLVYFGLASYLLRFFL